MKKIYYKGIEVKLNSTLNYNGLEVRITEDLIELNPEIFKVVEEKLTINILEKQRNIIFEVLFS